MRLLQNKIDLKVIIRKATPEDSDSIAPLLLLAMEEIVYMIIGEQNNNKAKEFLCYFAERENNQYSYQNCFVAEDRGEVVAALNIYDGKKIREFREPVIQYIKSRFNRNFTLEDETQEGEYYIDSFGVDPNHQGNGIGTKMLLFVINEYVNQKHQTLGLLVDEENLTAKKLYINLGFKSVGKKVLAGKSMDHLQIFKSHMS